MNSIVHQKQKVSVCIVTFNHAKYIKDCLLSAIMQHHDADLEILVGDDGSTDGTREVVRCIAEEHPGLMMIFNHDVHKGPSENIKFLIERASGDFIAHLDGDDFWLPGKLERQLEFLANNQKCIAAYTNAIVVDKANTLLGVFTNKQPQFQDINYLLRRGNYLSHSSLLYRSTAKNDILSIHGDLLDYRIHCCLASRGVLGYLNSTLVAYRAGAESSLISTTPDLVRRMFWQTIQEMHKTTAKADAIRDGASHFLGLVLFDSLWRRRPSYAFQWLKRIHRDMGANFFYIIIYGIVAFIRYGCKSTWERLLSIFSRNPLRIIHYR